MTNKLLVIVSCLWLCACNFDKEWEYDKRWPAILAVVNASGSIVQVQEVYADPSSDVLFSLKGKELRHGEVFSARISENVYDGVLVGKFFMEIGCNNKIKSVPGGRFERFGIHNGEQWTVRTTIRDCVGE